MTISTCFVSAGLEGLNAWHVDARLQLLWHCQTARHAKPTSLSHVLVAAQVVDGHHSVRIGHLW
jgi:hypothetical protein